MKKGISLFFGFIFLARLAQPALAASVIFAGAALNSTYCGANIWSAEGFHTVTVLLLDPADAQGALLLEGSINRCAGANTEIAGGQKSGETHQDAFMWIKTNESGVHCDHQRLAWTRGRIYVNGGVRALDEQDSGCEIVGECLGLQ